MTFKQFLVTFSALVLTTGLLFLIGHFFTIPMLMFHYEYVNDAEGLMVEAGSFVPLIIGLIVSFFAEKMYVRKYSKAA